MKHLLHFRVHPLVFIGSVRSCFPLGFKCLNSGVEFKKVERLEKNSIFLMPRCYLDSIISVDIELDQVSEFMDTQYSVLRSGEEVSCNLFNESICELCRMREVDKALVLLAEMEALGYRPNSMSYVALIGVLGSVGRTLEAEAIFQEMAGLGRVPGVKVFNVLLRSLLKKGLLSLAEKVLGALDVMRVKRNRETYEILLDYHVNARRLKDSWSVIAKMRKEGYRPNAFVYGKIIELYRDNGMWNKAIEIVNEIQDMGLSLDKTIYNSIIDTLGRCGELEEAKATFKKMKQDGIEPDIRTWNSLIICHSKSGDVDTALEFLIKMQEEGFYPDPKVFVRVITCLGEQGKWDTIKTTFDDMKCMGNQSSGAIYAVLVDIYGHYGKFQNADDCVNALRSAAIKLSADLFCVLANAYAQQGFCEQTVTVLKLMEAEGYEPNIVTLNILINAFATAGRHLEALAIYHHMKDTVGFSTLLGVLLLEDGRAGLSPDVVTYSTLMKAFVWAKKFDQVPEIYREMESAGCSPDRKAKDLLQTALTTIQQRHYY
ncbi:hypothetical protein Leryth_000234 [Lithospermum erythrorhizon]|nr:hypothetical protein Leryth_000234 [Lithospermum erythrorhizon]